MRAVILGKWENEARELQTQRPSGLQSDLLKSMEKNLEQSSNGLSWNMNASE